MFKNSNSKGSALVVIILALVILALAGFSLQQYYIYKNPQINNGVNNQNNNTNNTVITKGKILNLSNKGLTSVPSYVFSQTNLEELNVSNNSLTGAIQAEIRFLANLKVLDASYNNMTGVPAEIGQLQNLEVLNLSYNKLTGLPYELGNLKNLKILNLAGNQYSQQDLDRIKTTLPNTNFILK